MTGWVWLLLGVIGIALLGAAIAYGQVETRRRSREEIRRGERVTRERYDRPPHGNSD